MAHLIQISSFGSDEESGFFALRSDGKVYRCTLSSFGPVWELVEGAPNTMEGANLQQPTAKVMQ